MKNVAAIPKYENDLAFLQKISPATAKKIAKLPDIQARIARIAKDLFEIHNSSIHQLPKVIKFEVIERFIKENSQSEEILKVMPYLDPETISELLVSGVENNEKIAYHYCAETKSLFLNTHLSNADIHRILTKLSPTIKTSITKMDLSTCSSLEDITFLSEFPNITELDLSRAISLKSLDGIQRLPHLEQLILTSCQKLSSLNGLESNRSLITLKANKCSLLLDINALYGCQELQELDLSNCHLLQELQVIGELKNIEKLNLQGLANLKSLGFLKELPYLALLNIAYTGVKDLSTLNLSTLPQLQTESITL